MAEENAQDKDLVALITAIDTRLKKVHTQSLDLSFNELFDMYKENELDISPDFQRLFQWSEGARSRFIESLLLEMPVPPVYVIEEDDGKYLLIDGLQRISSYLHLRGELVAEHLDPPVKKGQKLVLTDCDIVAELNGRTFDQLGTALQIRLKRAFVRVEIIRKGSDPRFRYHMFKRLNTGGQLLSDQQVRNCTIRLLNETFNNFVIMMSKESAFQNCVATLSQERQLAAFDQELVLRFFAFKNWRANFRHDVSDFLTEYMEGVTEGILAFDYSAETECFKKTFALLDRTLGDRAFAIPNPQRTELTRGFSVYHFEAFTVGLQAVIGKLATENEDQMKRLTEVLRDIKFDPHFIKITTGGGKNSPGPLKDRIGAVEVKLAATL